MATVGFTGLQCCTTKEPDSTQSVRPLSLTELMRWPCGCTSPDGRIRLPQCPGQQHRDYRSFDRRPRCKQQPGRGKRPIASVKRAWTGIPLVFRPEQFLRKFHGGKPSTVYQFLWATALASITCFVYTAAGDATNGNHRAAKSLDGPAAFGIKVQFLTPPAVGMDGPTATACIEDYHGQCVALVPTERLIAGRDGLGWRCG